MLLAIDVGNTQTQFGVFAADGTLKADWRLTTDRQRTSDEMGLLSLSLLERVGLDADTIEHIVIASVVPPLRGALDRMAERYFDVQPLWVHADILDDLPILYEPPSDVGADRLVNAVAARERYGTPVVVVDFGTATTFDVIDPEGAYLGGVIATGIGVSADALFARAARLPRVDVAEPLSVIGRNTVGAVQAGLFWGYVELVEGLLRRIVKELGASPRVVATGGWARTIGAACEGIETVDDLLTIRGLRLIWERHGNG